MIRRFCPDCKEITPQKTVSYDPDDPESLIIWECVVCKNATGFCESPEIEILGKEQIYKPENQNRDKAIIGFRKVN